jgi:hypothetical protein
MSREDFLPESATKKHLMAKLESDQNLFPVDVALEALETKLMKQRIENMMDYLMEIMMEMMEKMME